MNLNLPAELTKSDFYLKKPFTIFEIHNFIDRKDYDNLVREILSFNDYTDISIGRGEKEKLTYTGSNLGEIELPHFKTFVTKVISKSFFQWFSKTHLPYFEKSLLPIHISKPKHILSKFFKRVNQLFGSPFSLFFIEVECSVIRKDASIPPHTDSSSKRLSMVFYISNKDLPEKMRIDLGTIFYGVKHGCDIWRRYNCKLLEKNEAKEFFINHQVAHISKFYPNQCVGFIKSDISWHGVRNNNYEFDRKTLVINVREL